MTPEQRTYHAKELATNPVLAEVMTELETAAIDAMTFAKPGEHDVRQAVAAELRALRAFRDRLNALSTVPRDTTRKSYA